MVQRKAIFGFALWDLGSNILQYHPQCVFMSFLYPGWRGFYEEGNPEDLKENL